MTFPNDPHERSPKGDHNRRIALGLERDVFAIHAGISVDDLTRYESTQPNDTFDMGVAQLVGEALERLEATRPHKIDNGAAPQTEDDENDLFIAQNETATYTATPRAD